MPARLHFQRQPYQLKAVSMDNLEERILTLENAIFGSKEEPRKTPGLINEFARLEQLMTIMNTTLKEMRDDARRIVWIVLAALAASVLKLVLT